MTTVSVHALHAGTLTLPERFFISPADNEARRSVPSLAFLVQHKDQTTDKTSRVVFDLGLRRDLSLYPAVLQKHCASRQPMTTRPDVVESLAAGGLSVNDIDHIIFSHVHYDHVGLPSDFTNPDITFVVGPGALDLLSGKSPLNIGSHSFFEADLLPLDRTTELPPTPSSHELTPESSNDSSQPTTASQTFTWSRFGQFPHTIDFFGDASVLIVSAPGHLPGHINLLCRLVNERYVYLAGDACHDIRLFTGERDIATWTDDEGKTCCIHADVQAAKETLARLRAVERDGLLLPDESRAQVEFVFAHNWAWEEDARRKGRFWPGTI